MESLDQFNIYKNFLDELRPQHAKDKIKADKALKLEAKRRRQAQSLEAGGIQRRGTRIDPSSRSVPPAQRKGPNAGQGGQNQGAADSTTNKQYEVEYHENLKPLFFEDSSNESYSLPFETPQELMTHFHELEEQNLSLIQQ